MEKNLLQILKDKGYTCETVCKCKVHQIKSLGIKEWTIPDLKNSKRIGIIKTLSTLNKKIKDNSIEKIETENTVFKKIWHESVGTWGELIVILEKSEELIISVEEIEENLDFLKFIQGEDKELNEYRKKIISLGIKSLFERGELAIELTKERILLEIIE